MTNIETLTTDYFKQKRVCEQNKKDREYHTPPDTAYEWYQDAQNLVAIATELKERLIKLYKNKPLYKFHFLLDRARWKLYCAMSEANHCYQLYSPASGILKDRPLPYPKNKLRQGKLQPFKRERIGPYDTPGVHLHLERKD